MGKYTPAATNSEDAAYERNARTLIVYLRCEPIADQSQGEAFLKRFRLRDGFGGKYAGIPLPASVVRYMRLRSALQQGMFDYSFAPEEWGVWSPVPEGSAHQQPGPAERSVRRSGGGFASLRAPARSLSLGRCCRTLVQWTATAKHVSRKRAVAPRPAAKKSGTKRR